MALPTFLKHLKVLEKSGVVSSEKVGRVRRVSLEVDSLAQAESWLASQRTLWRRRFDRLAALVQEMEEESEP